MVDSQQPKARLLIVDDEVPQMRALCDTLEHENYAPTGYSSAREAVAALKPGMFDLLLTDLKMPEMDGIALLRAAHAADPDLVSIVMTGHGSIDTAVEAMKAGALDYIQKPFKLSVVLPVLSRALAVQQLRRRNAELERRVLERTAELEAANQELEAFSYSVSHDLRAPLRAIGGFSNILVDRYGSQLPPEPVRLLGVVATNVTKMERLIEDLLRLSRLGRQTLEKRPVDLVALVNELVGELKQQHKGPDVEVVVGPLPAAEGDLALLRQVFFNLLSNGFKFTGQAVQPRIEVGFTNEGGETVYFVRDNGAGFDMRYAEKLFGVFQRLHTEAQFQGTGVGLSIVQRIVRRHGGRIWAEAAVNQGATFYFTLAEPAR